MGRGLLPRPLRPLLDFGECLERRLLFGLLLGLPLAAAAKPPGNRDLDDEGAIVVWPAGLHERVVRRFAEELLRNLLEPALVIDRRLAGRAHEILAKVVVHHLAGRAEATVEVHRADHGLERGGENRSLLPSAAFLLALAEAKLCAQVHRRRLGGENPGIDERRAPLRELPLVRAREALHQEI